MRLALGVVGVDLMKGVGQQQHGGGIGSILVVALCG
jgi:hypothetical protein